MSKAGLSKGPLVARKEFTTQKLKNGIIVTLWSTRCLIHEDKSFSVTTLVGQPHKVSTYL